MTRTVGLAVSAAAASPLLPQELRGRLHAWAAERQIGAEDLLARLERVAE